MKLIIDRIEGEFAVCETEQLGHININLDKLPSKINEGDIIELISAEWEVHKKETQLKKEKIQNRFDDLFN